MSHCHEFVCLHCILIQYSYGYLGFTNLASYDSEKCASKCNAISGCAAFNLYFERDPTKDPGTGCENPSSTTNIKVNIIVAIFC